jgi:TP901 family phage tail tape measure protein
MASGQIFELAILLSLRDAASGNLDRFKDRLRATGKEGRAALQEIESLQKSLKRDLVIGGMGVATLAMLKKGIDSAGDFESAMADLRLSIQEVGKDGQVNVGKMNAEMNKLESLSVRLGNKLPGTTKDFVEMLAVLKQGGLSTKTILDGTGEAVANLAVITKQVPKDLAEPFTQYALQFGLTGEEAVKLADTLARLKFATGLNPQDLIEGSKFFQLRVGAPLGFKGLEGADVSGRFLATLKRSGLEGGLGGREAATFLSHMITHADALKNVKKEFGIDVQLFDKKGQFLGFDNLFAQMEKFRKLSPEKQMQAFKELGGDEGAGVGVAIMKSGLEGWKNINAEIDKSSSQQQKLNEITGTYNAKLEATLGTLENLKVTLFTPALDFIKPSLDSANDFIGSMQSLAKEYPTVSKYTVGIIALAAGTTTVVSGIRALTTAWKLWRIVSAVGSSEESLLRFLRSTKAGADAAGDSLGAASRKAGGFRGEISGLSMLKTIGLTIAIAYTIENIHELYNEIENAKAAARGESRTQATNAQALPRLEADSRKAGVPVNRNIYTGQASALFSSMNRGDELLQSMHPNYFKEFFKTLLPGPQNPYRGTPLGGFGGAPAVKTIKERGAGQLENINIMREFISTVNKNMQPADAKVFLEAVQQAFPQSFGPAVQQLIEQSQKASEAIGQDADSALRFAPALINSANAAQNFANRINQIDLRPPSFPSLVPPADSSSAAPPPKSAIGSIVQRDGLAQVHRGNVIFPANLSRRGAGDWLSDLTALRTVASQASRDGGSVRLRVNRYNIAETARAVMQSESTNVFRPNIQLGNISVQSESNIESIIAQVKEEQKRQVEELRKQLNDRRRFDRMGARAVQIARERA